MVVIINNMKVPKIKKILLYETKFLVRNYSCLQNPRLGDCRPQIPDLCPQLNCWTPPPLNKIPGYATELRNSYRLLSPDCPATCRSTVSLWCNGTNPSSFHDSVVILVFTSPWISPVYLIPCHGEKDFPKPTSPSSMSCYVPMMISCNLYAVKRVLNKII